MEDDWNTNDIYKWNMWYRKAIIPYPTIDPLKMFVDVLLSMAKLLWYDSDAVASALFLLHSFIRKGIFWRMLFILHDKRWKIFFVSSTHDFFASSTKLHFTLYCSHLRYMSNIHRSIHFLGNSKILFKKEFWALNQQIFEPKHAKLTAQQIVGCTFHISHRWKSCLTKHKPCIDA